MWKELAGCVRFEIIGGQGERFLTDCAQSGIAVQNICPTATGFYAETPLRSYPKMHTMARKRRCRLRVREKKGIYFALLAYRGRWGIVLGLALAAFLLTAGSRLVWTVQFYDFTPAQQAALRVQLYNQGIAEGSMPSEEQLGRVQDGLFLENAVYGWVKLNFVRGRLVVEKVDAALPPPIVKPQIVNVVALCDGLIERVEVSDGFVEKLSGQSVAEGEILVNSQRVGITGAVLTRGAQAKVYAVVQRTYETEQPLTQTLALPCGSAKNYYTLCLLGGKLPLYWGKKVPAGAQETVLYRPCTLFGIPLPVTLLQTQVRESCTVAVELSQKHAAEIARARIYETAAAELPECSVRTCEESVTQEGNVVRFRMKMSALANIAKEVPAVSAAGTP